MLINKTLEKWEEYKICDCCEVYQPQTISTKEMIVNGAFPVFGANGQIGRYGSYNHENAEVLVTCRGATCGSINMSLPKSWINGNAMVVSPKQNNIDKHYLFYFLKNVDFSNYISGAAQPQITRVGLSPLIIKFPNLSEQQRIVGILDEAFENIEKVKQNALQNLNNAKELFESYLTSTLVNKDNWDKKKLSEVAIDFGRGRSRHRPRNDKKLYGGDYPFIQTGDIRNSNHFITEYSQTYNEIGLAQSKLWPKGTLCITIAANIAETGVLTFDACFPDSVIGCVFDETKTNIDYVEYLLQSFKAILQAEGKGSAQDNINLGTFEKQYFPFPDKSIQDEIVKKLDNMRKHVAELEQIYEQKLKDLDELKQSILQKAFNGEL